MGDLSPHFSRVEFADHRTGAVEVDLELVRRLEELRHICGDRPLRIVSGYRSAETNKLVGGAPNSQHLYGRAADIPAGYANVHQAQAAGFAGIGYCGAWVVHLDVRPGAPAVFEDC